MTYEEFVKINNILRSSLLTCLTSQNYRKFDFTKKQLDELYAEHPIHLAKMLVRQDKAA